MVKKSLALLVAVLMMAQMVPAFAATEFDVENPAFTESFDSREAVFDSGNWTENQGGSDKRWTVSGNVIKHPTGQSQTLTATLEKYVPTGDYQVSFDMYHDYAWKGDGYAEVLFNQSGDTQYSMKMTTLNSGGDIKFELKKGSKVLGSRTETGRSKKAYYHFDIAVTAAGNITVTQTYNEASLELFNITDAEPLAAGKFALRGWYTNFGMKNLAFYTPKTGGGDPAATVEAIGSSAQHNGETGTLRFTSKVTGEGIESFGASVLPVWIFDRDQGELTNAEVVTVEQAIADGETYGVDVTDIPAGQFGTEIYAKPFIYVDGQPIWSDAIQSSVDSALKE